MIKPARDEIADAKLLEITPRLDPLLSFRMKLITEKPSFCVHGFNI